MLGNLPCSWNKCLQDLLNADAQILIAPNDRDDAAPMAWDAVLEVVDDSIKITGGVGPCDYGDVTILLKKKYADRTYKMCIDVFNREEYESYAEILKYYDIRWEAVKNECKPV
jgi:hypothetical protein